MVLTSWILKASLWMSFVIVERNQVGARQTPYLETNEIIVDERAISLPMCRPHSICGHLQANARGINQNRICACEPGLNSCPMTWDPFDGHSVTQGSDQYKTCDSAAPALKMCEPRQTAYISRSIFSKSTEEILTKADYIKCICPESHNYEPANQHFEDLDADTEVMEFTYICAPLPPCQSTDPCKLISEQASAFLVNRKCVCPSDERCPTLAEDGVQTVPVGRGHLHLIRCQNKH